MREIGLMRSSNLFSTFLSAAAAASASCARAVVDEWEEVVQESSRHLVPDDGRRVSLSVTD